jgi:hypothetical protein
VYTFNFGQRPFAYTPPSGFKSLCTTNLPDPTIKQPNQYFDATTYTGNGGTKTVTNSGEFQPDLVWIKMRSDAAGNELFDSIRGANNVLYTNATNAESNSGTMSSFNSNGFTALYQSGDISTNNNGSTFVGWQWKAASANTTNTDGSITSTVSANTSAGFSVVTFTANLNGTTANSETYGHGLGVAPSMIILKTRSATSDWWVYHSSLGTTKGISLNSTAGVQTSGYFPSVTSSTFIMGSSVYSGGSQNYVAYCFSEVAGYSKFGSYTGNGSTDGPFVYCGFRPRFIMFKNASASGNDWKIFDSSRNTSNIVTRVLYPNLTNAEETNTGLDFVSNGFKWRDNGSAQNGSGNSIIFAAFAESPFKYSRAR